MEKKSSKNPIIRGAILVRAQFIELVLIALILALGINLVSYNIQDALSPNRWVVLFIGVGLCLAPIIYLGIRVFSGHSEIRKYEGFLIYDAETNEIISVPRYELSESVTRYLKGAFSENEALRVLWDKESIRAFGTAESVQLMNETENSQTYAVKELRSFDLVCKAVEYFLLSELSTHLTDYFQDGKFREKNLKQYGREDLPDIHLTNQFLELFSRPMDQRPAFVHETFEPSMFGEVYVTVAPSGAIYEKFDLILPKGSTVQRGHGPCEIGQSRIEIKTSRMSISFEVRFDGFSTWLPRGFIEYYFGIDERKTMDSLETKVVDIDVKIH